MLWCLVYYVRKRSFTRAHASALRALCTAVCSRAQRSPSIPQRLPCAASRLPRAGGCSTCSATRNTQHATCGVLLATRNLLCCVCCSSRGALIIIMSSSLEQLGGVYPRVPFPSRHLLRYRASNRNGAIRFIIFMLRRPNDFVRFLQYEPSSNFSVLHPYRLSVINAA